MGAAEHEPGRAVEADGADRPRGATAVAGADRRRHLGAVERVQDPGRRVPVQHELVHVHVPSARTARSSRGQDRGRARRAQARRPRRTGSGRRRRRAAARPGGGATSREERRVHAPREAAPALGLRAGQRQDERRGPSSREPFELVAVDHVVERARRVEQGRREHRRAARAIAISGTTPEPPPTSSTGPAWPASQTK